MCWTKRHPSEHHYARIVWRKNRHHPLVSGSENFRDQFQLSPAKVISIEMNENEHKATVEVDNAQLSLAIGKGGQNVRLAINDWMENRHQGRRLASQRRKSSGRRDSNARANRCR